MIFRAVCSGRVFGQTVQNVMHFQKPDAVWPTDGNGLAAAIRDNWLGGTNGLKTMQTNDCVWNSITVYDAENRNLSPITLVVSIQGTDSNAATQIMAFAATILRIRAQTGGKHGRGRIYLPAPRFGFFINGALTAAAITSWNPVLTQLASAFLTSSASTGFEIGIAPRSTPGNFIVASGFQLAPTAGVQRRRNLGVGS